MKIRLDRVSASESGDYFQVVFESPDDEGGAYILIQGQLEDDDGGLCYLESHDQDYTGHFHVASASLARNRFCFQLRRAQASEVEVMFQTADENYDEVVRVMRIIIPCLEVVEP